MIISETELMNSLKLCRQGKGRVIVPKGFKIKKLCHPIRFENQLYGFADVVSSSWGIPMVVEIKGKQGRRHGGTDLFWDATKVLAYSKILSMIDEKDYISGIMLPRDTISTKISTLAICLGIALFSYYLDEETKEINILSMSR